jgi:hypothetical protein
MTLPSQPRSARIQWTWRRPVRVVDEEEVTVQGWLTLYPSGLSFSIQDDTSVYVMGLPRIDAPFDQAQFEQQGGKILQWVDY